MKIALAMIVAGTDEESVLLDNCLNSVEGVFDAIYIGVNRKKNRIVSQKVLDVCHKHKAFVEESIWRNNFVEARNTVFESVPKDYEFIMWLDADDTIDHPEKIREVLDIVSPKVDGIFINYEYAHDAWGNVTVSHYVARIVRNNGSYTWKSSIDDEEVSVHETLVEKRRVQNVLNLEFAVVHHADDARQSQSLVRNIELLEAMYQRAVEKKNVDPRILYYLATHYYDAGKYNEAKELLTQYLKVSGWAEERAQAHIYLGDIAKLYKDTVGARLHYLQAIGEAPDDSKAYIELGQLEYEQKLWDKAITWLENGITRKPKQDAIVKFPLEATYRAYKLLAECHVNKGGTSIEIASRWLDKALELRPNEPELLEAQATIDKVRGMRDATLDFIEQVKLHQRDQDFKSIRRLVESQPPELQDNPAVLAVRRKYMAAKIWPKKSIVIMCGASPLGIWGPWSLKDGISGSEEAVIRLTKHLANLGWQVTVYATPGDRAGEIDGVDWKQYWEFNPKDIFDVFIAWRSPWTFDTNYKASKKYLWLHDVMGDEEITPERMKNLDKVMLLSQFHRECYPSIPEDKVFLTGNGIDSSEFERTDVSRDVYKVVYMSSQVRGQEQLLDMWPEVVRAVPNATLHLYYGWNGWDEMEKSNPERMAWKQAMITKIDSMPSVTDHGRVDQAEIVQTILEAGVWAYPCAFPEISCITAMKAQAGGAIPVTSDYAALNETVQFGRKVRMRKERINSPFTDEDLKRYKNALIAMLLSPKEQYKIRLEMMDSARRMFDWRNVAEGWSDEFSK